MRDLPRFKDSVSRETGLAIARGEVVKASSCSGLDAPVSGGHISEPLAVIFSQRILIEAPAPVTLSAVGQIHARFGSQSQQILQRHDCRVSHRSQYGANKIPVDLLAIGI